MTDFDPTTEEIINKRQHVRIYYPTDCHQVYLPELVIHQRSCRILDISEGGIRFSAPNAFLLDEDVITGWIYFTDSSSLEIRGRVVRRFKGQIAMKLEKGIPYSRILSEQTRLRNLERKRLISFVRN